MIVNRKISKKKKNIYVKKEYSQITVPSDKLFEKKKKKKEKKKELVSQVRFSGSNTISREGKRFGTSCYNFQSDKLKTAVHIRMNSV